MASGNWFEEQADRELRTEVVFGELCGGEADAGACEDLFAGTLAAATSAPATIAEPPCGNCVPELVYVVTEQGGEFTVVPPDGLAALLGPVDTLGEVVLLHGDARVRAVEGASKCCGPRTSSTVPRS